MIKYCTEIMSANAFDKFDKNRCVPAVIPKQNKFSFFNG